MKQCGTIDFSIMQWCMCEMTHRGLEYRMRASLRSQQRHWGWPQSDERRTSNSIRGLESESDDSERLRVCFCLYLRLCFCLCICPHVGFCDSAFQSISYICSARFSYIRRYKKTNLLTPHYLLKQGHSFHPSTLVPHVLVPERRYKYTV